MLVEFTVKNYRSIKEAQTLSLVKSKLKDDKLADTHSFDPEAPATPELLRSAVIYGANASGKSNLLRALEDMRWFVLFSTNLKNNSIYQPFKFDKTSRTEPSEFEIVFVQDNVRYQYGFVISKDKVLEEWLIAYPKGRAQHWFSREYDEETGKSTYELGKSLKGKKSVWQESTREDALFLTTAVQLNSEQLDSIYDFFDSKFALYKSSDISQYGGSGVATFLTSEEFKDIFRPTFLTFLQVTDFNIVDIDIKLEDANAEEEYVDISTIHKTKNGDLVKLDLLDESEGTQQLIKFLPFLITTLIDGGTLIIDELNNHLHPALVEYFVKTFHGKFEEPLNRYQLIFTTHETSLLNHDLFRRDQIWFCEKNDEQATELYPLTDFNPRKEHNLEQGYLSGRYGALPFLRDFDLFEVK